MALKLSEAPETYREFYGRSAERMPKLIADGRVPMSFAGLMQRRLDVRNAADVKGSWMDSYFDTGDAVVYHPDGRTKIVLDSQHLRDMAPESSRNDGKLVLTFGDYNHLQGEEFKKGKLGKTNERLSREDVKNHPVWKTLARDQVLLDDYTDFIFSEYWRRFSKEISFGDLRLMQILPDSANGNTPEMSAWCIFGLRFGSGAGGWGALEEDDGRLLGIG